MKPNNGDYMVNSVDAAQKTRYITANLKFDVNVWGRWAEENGIDTRCINFLLMHPELVTQETNARSISTFFNSISSIGIKFRSKLELFTYQKLEEAGIKSLYEKKKFILMEVWSYQKRRSRRAVNRLKT